MELIRSIEIIAGIILALVTIVLAKSVAEDLDD